jgi:RecJ-like exonuclease
VGKLAVLSRLHPISILKINLLNARASNVKYKGIPLAQVSVRRDGDLHMAHSLDSFQPGTKFSTQRVLDSVDKNVWDRCSDCHGKGKISGKLRPTQRCKTCNGIGYIPNTAGLIASPQTKLEAEKDVSHRPTKKPRTRKPIE